MKVLFLLLLFVYENGAQTEVTSEELVTTTTVQTEFNFLDFFLEIIDKFDLENLTLPNDSIVGNLIINTINLLSDVSLAEIGQEVITVTENECSRHLKLIYNGIINNELWGLQMLDAMAKPQSGVWYGNIMHIGNYDECLSINKFINYTRISGKYCSAVVSINENSAPEPPTIDRDNVQSLRLSYGFCIPSVCSVEDMNSVFSTLRKYINTTVNMYFKEEFCDYKGKTVPFSKMDIFAIIVFGGFAVVISMSTFYDIFLSVGNKSSKRPNLLLAFSCISNARKLFSTKTSGGISCLDGMRIISMIWIIFCHRYMYTMYLPVINMRYLLTWKNKYNNSFVFGGSMAVDTFFIISGFLVTYLYLCSGEKGQKINWFKFYLHRILRLTPSLAMMILFYATLFIRIGRGPFWFLVHYFFQERCETNWWSTLLYIQNYATPVAMCVGQSWYLAVDTQLYFISPIMLLSLTRWPKKTLAVLVLLGTASCIYTFKISYDKETGPGFFGVSDDLFKLVYASTHSRCSPWILGAFTGYIFFRCKNKFIKINKVVLTLMWLLSLTAMFVIIFYHTLLTDIDKKYVLEGAIFNGFLRPIWSLAVCVIIFICATGNGGIVNKFFGCTIFHILTRINYSVYLVHIAVIVFFVGHTQTPLYFSNLGNYHAFWGDLAYTWIVSTIWTLAFESPVVELEKIFFGSTRKPNKSTSNGTSLEQNGQGNIGEPQLTRVNIISKNSF